MTRSTDYLEERGFDRTMSGVFECLEGMGFNTPGHGSVRADSLSVFYETLKARRLDLPEDVDGVVLSVDGLDKLADLGIAEKDCPRGQIALKYPAAAGITTIRAVEVSADGGEHLSPVAIFDPVDLAGAEVTRASLKSFGWMFDRDYRVEYYRKELRNRAVPADEIPDMAQAFAGEWPIVGVGSVVEVSRQGDVIPYIRRICSNALGSASEPEACPACGGAVVPAGPFRDCADDECRAKEAYRMNRFLKALRVKGLDQTTLLLYADAGVRLRDFFLRDGFELVTGKLIARGGISMVVWKKVRAQLVA